MKRPSFRTTVRRPAIEIVRPLNQWVVEGRHVYRVCVVRLADGTLDLFDMPEAPLGVAA